MDINELKAAVKRAEADRDAAHQAWVDARNVFDTLRTQLDEVELTAWCQKHGYNFHVGDKVLTTEAFLQGRDKHNIWKPSMDRETVWTILRFGFGDAITIHNDESGWDAYAKAGILVGMRKAWLDANNQKQDR